MKAHRPAVRDDAVPKSAARDDWTRHKERGNRFALWFMVSLAFVFGRHVARIAAGFAVAWYLVRAFAVRRHVYDFLRRVLARPPRFRDLVKTYWTFGTVTLDRVFLTAGRDAGFDVRVHGAELLDALQARGEGAILLGAHLGNFLALHALGRRRRGLAVHILQYPDQNPMITNVMARLNPALAANVIPLGSPDVLVRLGRAVEAGDFAALLADRMGPKDTRGVKCEFLGASAVFPSGGAEAALVLGCPLLVFFGLYRGGNRYELYFERLDEGERPVRAERRAVTERLVRRYAERLAHYARLAPYNWFNFYDYWASGPR
ncbi:MAG: lipid A biosynthesis acyltransferase [Gammaproteobacteria bacterium]